MSKGRDSGAQVRTFLATLAFLGMVVVAGTSLAWACVPQANLVTLQPNASGASGVEVTVEGVGLDPGPAEVRWNSADGLLLAQGEGPNLTVPITIPEASPGLYSVVVVSRQAGGGIGNTSTAAFEVTRPGEAPAPAVVAPPSRTVAPTETSPNSAMRNVISMTAGAGLLILGVLLGTVLDRRRRP
jgi:hypothetical protein